MELPEDLASELDEVEESSSVAASDETPPDEAPDEAVPGGPLADLDAAELRDRYLRLAAEFENHKRRALKERQELLSFATENLIKELLGTVDNLERALGHARHQEEGGDTNNLLEGVELTYRSLMHVLEKMGVKVVAAQGELFDPKVHEAIRKVPTDEHTPGTVIEVFQTGYLLKDRLLRPARVAISGQSGNE